MKVGRLGTYTLICHPKTPALGVSRIELGWTLLPDGRLMLRWKVEGAQHLVVPSFAGKGRADGLWEHSCFEIFLKDSTKKGGTAYREFNFSPSERWAAYGFGRYREDTTEIDIDFTPTITAGKGLHMFICTVMLPATLLEGFTHAGVSAVIEEEGGHKSYWALSHAADVPDFHRAESFSLSIAEAGKA